MFTALLLNGGNNKKIQMIMGFSSNCTYFPSIMIYFPRHESSCIYPLRPPTKPLFVGLVKAVTMIHSSFLGVYVKWWWLLSSQRESESPKNRNAPSTCGKYNGDCYMRTQIEMKEKAALPEKSQVTKKLLLPMRN